MFSFEGYRLHHYRSPTPKHSEHAETLDTAALLTLLKMPQKPALLDVQPLPWSNVFIQKNERRHIPGSIWLPNVGMGELKDDWNEYFQEHLKRATNGDKGYPIVLYCRADCWMSWNALKRANEWGYTNLYWYRNGTDEWLQLEQETSIAVPESFPLQQK